MTKQIVYFVESVVWWINQEKTFSASNYFLTQLWSHYYEPDYDSNMFSVVGQGGVGWRVVGVFFINVAVDD